MEPDFEFENPIDYAVNHAFKGGFYFLNKRDFGLDSEVALNSSFTFVSVSVRKFKFSPSSHVWR